MKATLNVSMMWIESQAFIEDSTGRFHVQRSCECVPMARRGPYNITFQGARPWHRTRSRHPDDTFCLRQVEYDAVLCGALNKTLACFVEEVSSISLHQCIAQRCWGALLASCETQWALAVQFLHGMQALALKRQRRSSKSSSSLFFGASHERGKYFQPRGAVLPTLWRLILPSMQQTSLTDGNSPYCFSEP